jgi:hypothetical protein
MQLSTSLGQHKKQETNQRQHSEAQSDSVEELERLEKKILAKLSQKVGASLRG